MVSKGPLLRLLTAINRRRMKLLMGLAFIAYVASVWGNFVNMRTLQENGDQKVESKIEEAVAPLREKIKDLEKRLLPTPSLLILALTIPQFPSTAVLQTLLL